MVGADSECESSEEEVAETKSNNSGWFSFLPKALQNLTGAAAGIFGTAAVSAAARVNAAVVAERCGCCSFLT